MRGRSGRNQSDEMLPSWALVARFQISAPARVKVSARPSELRFMGSRLRSLLVVVNLQSSRACSLFCPARARAQLCHLCTRGNPGFDSAAAAARLSSGHWNWQRAVNWLSCFLVFYSSHTHTRTQWQLVKVRLLRFKKTRTTKPI